MRGVTEGKISKSLKIAAVVSAFLIGIAVSRASIAGPAIQVDAPISISSDDVDAQHFESWLAINPLDPGNRIAASIVLGRSTGVSVYTTVNSGASWVRAEPPSGGGSLFGGIDPAITFDHAGNAYLVTLGDEVRVWRSFDGGRSWQEPVPVPGGGDRPFIACTEVGDHRTEIHVVSKAPITIFGHRPSDWNRDFDMISLATSNDLGRTFRFPRLLLTDYQKELLNVVSDLLVMPDGRIIVALQTFPPQNMLGSPLTASYSTIVSDDGGRTFSDPRPIASFRTYGHANEGKSLFGLGFARLAVDNSSRVTRGRLYAVWLDAIDGYYRVLAATSEDGGRTWSNPLRIEDDAPHADSSNPAVAVDGKGVVGVVWNDRRFDTGERCFQPYFSASIDGGKTFSKNQIVDTRLTCPIGAEKMAPSESEFRFKNGGETQGISGLPGGGFQLAWIGGGKDGGRGTPLTATTVHVSEPR